MCVCVCVGTSVIVLYCERVEVLTLNFHVFCGPHRGGFIDFI